MNVEVTLEACEPGALLEGWPQWPISIWIRPAPVTGGHCGEVSIQGHPEELVPFLVEHWGMEESDAWDVILAQQPPTCVHCGLEIQSGLVTNADGDPYHELCKRKEEQKSTVRRLADVVDMPLPPEPIVITPEPIPIEGRTWRRWQAVMVVDYADGETLRIERPCWTRAGARLVRWGGWMLPSPGIVALWNSTWPGSRMTRIRVEVERRRKEKA